MAYTAQFYETGDDSLHRFAMAVGSEALLGLMYKVPVLPWREADTTNATRLFGRDALMKAAAFALRAKANFST